MSIEASDSIGRRNPITFLVFALCEIAVVIIVGDIRCSISAFLLLIIVAFYLGKGGFFLGTIAKTLTVLIVLILLMQSLFYQGASDVIWSWKFLSIKGAGTFYGACLCLVLLNISGSIYLLFLLTTPQKLVGALEARGLPPKASYVVLSTFQIIPQMKQRSMKIMDAQRSRGMETEGGFVTRAKAFLPTLVPLVLGSVVSTEERALMLEARAFTCTARKTHLRVLHDTQTDRVLRFIFVFIVVAVAIGRVILWLL